MGYEDTGKFHESLWLAGHFVSEKSL